MMGGDRTIGVIAETHKGKWGVKMMERGGREQLGEECNIVKMD